MARMQSARSRHVDRLGGNKKLLLSLGSTIKSTRQIRVVVLGCEASLRRESHSVFADTNNGKEGQ